MTNGDYSDVLESFQKHVPIIDYEEMESYIDLIKSGEENVLWKGKPKYLGTTSGTTS
jgi:hypothetical protein